MEHQLIFGEKLGSLEYEIRTGCYAVVLDEDKKRRNEIFPVHPQ